MHIHCSRQNSSQKGAGPSARWMAAVTAARAGSGASTGIRIWSSPMGLGLANSALRIIQKAREPDTQLRNWVGMKFVCHPRWLKRINRQPGTSLTFVDSPTASQHEISFPLLSLRRYQWTVAYHWSTEYTETLISLSPCRSLCESECHKCLSYDLTSMSGPKLNQR